MERFFGQEFPGGEVIKFEEARAGHEEELVKIVSLLMYLGTVKYPNPSLATTLQVRVHVYCGQNRLLLLLQDGKLFSKEVQLRIKCILQVKSNFEC